MSPVISPSSMRLRQAAGWIRCTPTNVATLATSQPIRAQAMVRATGNSSSRTGEKPQRAATARVSVVSAAVQLRAVTGLAGTAGLPSHPGLARASAVRLDEVDRPVMHQCLAPWSRGQATLALRQRPLGAPDFFAWT